MSNTAQCTGLAVSLRLCKDVSVCAECLLGASALDCPSFWLSGFGRISGSLGFGSSRQSPPAKTSDAPSQTAECIFQDKVQRPIPMQDGEYPMQNVVRMVPLELPL